MASPGASQSSAHIVATSHPFTCNTCQVAFRTSELQRGHMRSDWHRYNLKRRVASLPPLSSEVFTEKVLSAQANSSAAAAKASFEKTCAACQKTYYSENAFQNHLGSQKHKHQVVVLQNGHKEEIASVLSSTFSLGEPIEMETNRAVGDTEAEKEFSKVVNGLKNTEVKDDPLSRRPTRPHHSGEGADEKPAHPLSESPNQMSKNNEQSTATNTSTPKPEETSSRCIFCNYSSPNLSLNVQHMFKFHGLFIPEQSYLVDLPGLINYLHRKVMDYNQCLYCNKIKSNAGAVQEHMKDKGHCMIAFESEDQMLEIGDFYDFTSTYSASDIDEDSDTEVTSATEEAYRSNGGKKPGLGSGNARTSTKIVLEDGTEQEVDDNAADEADGDEDEGGWETASSLSSIDSAEIGALPIDDHSAQIERMPLSRHHSHADARLHKSADGYHSHAHAHHAVYYDDYELHLPSGRSAGHRSLARYYRQNLRGRPTAEERRLQQMEIEERETAAAVLPPASSTPNTNEDENSNGNGGSKAVVTRTRELGMLGVSAVKRREIEVTEKRERKREQRVEARYRAGLDKRGNNQKHFRDPLLQ